MIKSKEVKLAVEIAFLFTIVTGVLYITNFIGSIIIDGGFKHIGSLLSYPNLRLIFIIDIIAVLAVIIKKYYKENLLIVAKKPIVLLISGLITGIQGIISASIIPAYISTISSNIEMLKQHGEPDKSIITKMIISNSFSILMILIQITIAIFLILFYRKLKLNNDQDLSVQSSQK